MRRTYLTGVSEGGLVASLLAEQSPDLFSGVLSTCGPIGDFRRQIDHVGDFRVLFDYFFPGVLPGNSIEIPQEVMDNWITAYVPAITNALAANPGATLQLMSTSQAAVDPEKIPGTALKAMIGLLWHNVFGTNDAVAKLGGNPYDNRTRRYTGSTDDELLNAQVQRFTASTKALEKLTRYQTSGQLTILMVTLHTTGDEIVPFWHQLLYLDKLQTSGTGRFTPIPLFRYAHCEFTTAEVLLSYALLVYQVTGSELEGAPHHPNLAQWERARRGASLSNR